jgi:peptidyl-prolyl cis-trans isomerase-like protein 2
MANKGKNTNSSQFFILYREAKHLDRKHTIFAKVVGGMDVLDKMEAVPSGDGDRPLEDIVIREVVVFVDPFEEFLKKRREAEEEEMREKEKKRLDTEEDRVTWTGKRIRDDGTAGNGGGGGASTVGKYLKTLPKQEDEIVEEVVEDDFVYQEPVKKKTKTGGGFGNFDAW